jgi:hypothetical protein
MNSQGGVDDGLLPGFEGDRALVLLAGAVLREKTPEVHGVQLHLMAPLSADSADRVPVLPREAGSAPFVEPQCRESAYGHGA